MNETSETAEEPLRVLESRLADQALGIEISGSRCEPHKFSPYRVLTQPMFAQLARPARLVARPDALPIPTGCLDFLMALEVLERVPDALSALTEWARVVRPGGFLYLVVANRERTFDHTRDLTPITHFLNDFRRSPVKADIDRHIYEYAHETDWKLLEPQCPGNHAYHRNALRATLAKTAERGNSLDITFHTFEPASLVHLLKIFGLLGRRFGQFQIVAQSARLPMFNGEAMGLLIQRNGSHRPPRSTFAGTISIPSSVDGVPGLPIVCPVTLEPLSASAESGETHFVALKSRHRYPCNGGCALLQVPAGSRAKRKARTFMRRNIRYAASMLRLACVSD